MLSKEVELLQQAMRRQREPEGLQSARSVTDKLDIAFERIQKRTFYVKLANVCELFFFTFLKLNERIGGS